jgi:hypothetical protein
MMRDATSIPETPAAPANGSAAPPQAGVADMLRAWSHLLNLELALARKSLLHLMLGTIAAAVIGLSAWLGLNALLVALIQAFTNSWLLALLFGAVAQLLALAMLLHGLRRWARDLTLPESRAALARAMARMS